MPDARHVTPQTGDVLLLVGTMKGAFLLRADPARASSGKWAARTFPAARSTPWPTTAATDAIASGPARTACIGARCSGRATTSARTWTNPEEANVKFPEGTEAALKNIWQIVPGRESEPGHALLRRRAGGAVRVERRRRFVEARGRALEPSAATEVAARRRRALPAHDPARSRRRARIRVAISTAGMYVTEDGRRDVAALEPGRARASSSPTSIRSSASASTRSCSRRAGPERMFLQNHWGLYRSDDRGETWTDIANGVPSDFGFAMGIHPDDPDCGLDRAAGVGPVPLHAGRKAARLPDATTRARAGKPMTEGLPQDDAYETVLRDAMAVDPLAPAGVYFGTRSGKLFGSADEGETLVRAGRRACPRSSRSRQST